MYLGLKKRVAYYILQELRHDHIHRHHQMAAFSFDHISNSINVFGRFSGDELDFLRNWVFSRIQNSVCLDVGANVGNHSVFFRKYFDQVLAFEPNPRTFNLLRVNSEPFSNLQCFPFGASDRDGTVRAICDRANVGASAIISNDDRHQERRSENCGEEVSFQVRRLENILEDLGIRSVDFIKIDVEGHELEALRGLEKVLQRDHPVLAFESNNADNEGAGALVLDFLRSVGYEHFYEMYDYGRIQNLPYWPQKILKAVIFLTGGEVKSNYLPKRISNLRGKNYPLIISTATPLYS